MAVPLVLIAPVTSTLPLLANISTQPPSVVIAPVCMFPADALMLTTPPPLPGPSVLMLPS